MGLLLVACSNDLHNLRGTTWTGDAELTFRRGSFTARGVGSYVSGFAGWPGPSRDDIFEGGVNTIFGWIPATQRNLTILDFHTNVNAQGLFHASWIYELTADIDFQVTPDNRIELILPGGHVEVFDFERTPNTLTIGGSRFTLVR
jgi:hypothetical protein